MLERNLDQSSGLNFIAPHCSTRVIAVAAHNHPAMEKQLLNGIAHRVSTLAPPVALLDFTEREPTFTALHGQTLDDAGFEHPSTIRLQPRAVTWTTAPTQERLAQQFRRNETDVQPLLQLCDELAHFNVIVVYAPMQILCSLLDGTGIEPVIAATFSESSLFSSYQAIKQALLIGHIRPTIACISNKQTQSPPTLQNAIGRSLQDCASRFLQCQLDAIPVSLGTTHDNDSFEPLALRLLENGVPFATRYPEDSIRAEVRAFEGQKGIH